MKREVRGESEDSGLVCIIYRRGYRRRTKYGGAPAIIFPIFSSKSKTRKKSCFCFEFAESNFCPNDRRWLNSDRKFSVHKL